MGLIWFPYRAIETAGMDGALATCLTYFFPLLAGLVAFRGHIPEIARTACFSILRRCGR
jgi:hypothetical protein